MSEFIRLTASLGGDFFLNARRVVSFGPMAETEREMFKANCVIYTDIPGMGDHPFMVREMPEEVARLIDEFGDV